MKLKTFLDFVEQFKVTKVLNTDPSKSGTITNIDYDEKMITIRKVGGGNSLVKLQTLLQNYQLQLHTLGMYVRLGSSHEYKVNQVVKYSNGDSKFDGTTGVVFATSGGGHPRIRWADGTVSSYNNPDWTRNHIFVEVKTQEQINIEAYQARMKKIAYEEMGKRDYFVLVPNSTDPEGRHVNVCAIIRAKSAGDAKSQLPPILRMMPEKFYTLACTVGK